MSDCILDRIKADPCNATQHDLEHVFRHGAQWQKDLVMALLLQCGGSGSTAMDDGVVLGVTFDSANNQLVFSGQDGGFNGPVSLDEFTQFPNTAPTSPTDTGMFTGTPPSFAMINEPAPVNLVHIWNGATWQTITSSNPS